MAQLYYAANPGAQPAGPVDAAGLKAWKDAGHLKEGWKVCPAGGTDWRLPAEVPEVATALGLTQAAPPPPPPSAAPTAPPAPLAGMSRERQIRLLFPQLVKTEGNERMRISGTWYEAALDLALQVKGDVRQACAVGLQSFRDRIADWAAREAVQDLLSTVLSELGWETGGRKGPDAPDVEDAPGLIGNATFGVTAKGITDSYGQNPSKEEVVEGVLWLASEGMLPPPKPGSKAEATLAQMRQAAPPPPPPPPPTVA